VPLAKRPADDFLAATRTVQLGGIDEIDAATEGMVQRANGGVVVDSAPVAAQLPAPEGNLTDLPSGPAEGSVLHR